MSLKLITSGNDDKAASGLRQTNALPTCASISKARPGFLKTFLPTFLIHLVLFYQDSWKSDPNPCPSIVLPLTILVFSNSKHALSNYQFNLFTRFFIKCYLTIHVFCTLVVLLAKPMTTSFKSLKAQLIGQILIICRVKVNVSWLKSTSSFLSFSK